MRELRKALAGRIAREGPHRLICFRKAQHFVQWLSEQASPPLVLLTDWREAKPCVEAQEERDSWSGHTLVYTEAQQPFVRASKWAVEQRRHRRQKLEVLMAPEDPEEFAEVVVGYLWREEERRGAASPAVASASVFLAGHPPSIPVWANEVHLRAATASLSRELSREQQQEQQQQRQLGPAGIWAGQSEFGWAASVNPAEMVTKGWMEAESGNWPKAVSEVLVGMFPCQSRSDMERLLVAGVPSSYED